MQNVCNFMYYVHNTLVHKLLSLKFRKVQISYNMKFEDFYIACGI